MRAVISGATGAVGMALIAELVERGDQVLVLCRRDSARSRNIREENGVCKAECSLEEMNRFTLPEGEAPYDVFFHFAWEGTTGKARNDMELQCRNIVHTLDAVRLAHRLGCKTFIGAGSQAEYGRVEGKLTEKTPAFPENGYGMAKLCAGQMSRVLCEELGLRHIWVRILSVYGPYDTENSMVMSTVRKLKAGEETAFTPGEQIWDYLYSGDAAKAFCALAERGHAGEVYCLGGGVPTPLKDYILCIVNTVAPQSGAGLGKLPYAPKQVMYLCADIGKLKADTGYAPATSFEEGLSRTLAWYDGKTASEQ